jgi:hypothetical protein
MPFYCGERSTDICVVLGTKKSSTYSSEYASGFFEPAASHLPASPSPRHEGLLGQAPALPAEIVSGHFEGVLDMLDLRTDGICALQQDDIESALPIFDVVTSQVLRRQADQLLLLPLMDRMDGSAECVGSTRLDLDKDQYLTVFSHYVQFPHRRTQIAGHDSIPLMPQILLCSRFPFLP